MENEGFTAFILELFTPALTRFPSQLGGGLGKCDICIFLAMYDKRDVFILARADDTRARLNCQWQAARPSLRDH